jgi:hypothetical protein
MALQPSGNSISALDIRNEFGATSGTSVSFGDYRVSQTVSGLSNLALDNEVSSSGIITALMPQSGTIKFSDFYSKKLNVIIDETPAPGQTNTKVNARSDYDANGSKITVIGGFKQRPSNPAGTKAWVHTNGDIGSDQKSNTREYSSLLTGTFDATTDLRVDIGPTGRVFGAGGNGGNGGSASNQSANDGSPGNNGTSSVGINPTTSTILNNRGRIQCGGGGGGGGGGAWSIHVFYVFPDTGSSVRTSDAGGGGGGGGAGYPAGSGGLGGTATANPNLEYRDSNAASPGTNGDPGTLLNPGLGKDGGTAQQFASNSFGGKGGDSKSFGLADNGGNGTGNGSDGGSGQGEEKGGEGGSSGYAVVVNGPSGSITIRDNGTIVGDTVYNKIPL